MIDREFKFRVWSGVKMLYDFYLNSKGEVFLTYRDLEDGDIFIGPKMLYTGLKDIKGKEIWQADILKSNDGHVQVVCYTIRHINKTNGHGDYGFITLAGFKLESYTKDFEIIGNLFETPELLKV